MSVLYWQAIGDASRVDGGDRWYFVSARRAPAIMTQGQSEDVAEVRGDPLEIKMEKTDNDDNCHAEVRIIGQESTQQKTLLNIILELGTILQQLDTIEKLKEVRDAADEIVSQLDSKQVSMLLATVKHPLARHALSTRLEDIGAGY